MILNRSIFAVVMLALCIVAHAQVRTPAPKTDQPTLGTIDGKVVNESGQSLAGAALFVRAANSMGNARTATSDLEGNFLVLDARSGEAIYRFNTGGPLAGGVVTWEQKGQQYIAVASGHSGGSIPVTGSTTIVVFAY